tara:strand:+ start:171 stop:470 length:300 start_codon:yes stop_codon:yes gene_type:complete
MEIGTKIRKAILKINPIAEFIIRGETIDGVEWFNDTTPIAKSDIETKMAEVQSEYDTQEYARKRKAEYPSIADQLDDIFHNGVEGWKTSIQVIKTKYPK